MLKYINIHTHNYNGEDNIDSIVSFFPDDNISSIQSAFSMGLHPWHVKTESYLDSIELLSNNIENSNLLAIGECGLDRVCNADFELQKRSFQLQIDLSEKAQKPMIIHCVKAFPELIQIKKEYSPKQQWIIHGYRGNIEMARQLINHKCVISFGSGLEDGKNKLSRVFAEIPLESIFLETDAKDVSIKHIYKSASEILNLPADNLKLQLMQNYKRIFGN